MSKQIGGNLPLTFSNNREEDLKNYRIYGTAEGVGVETENLVTETIQGVTINSAGKLVSSSTLNASIAPITSGKTYTLLKDYIGSTLYYAFFTDLPAKGSTSYDGNRGTSSELSMTITAPITGYVVVLNKENKATVAEGSTAIPYGYKIPLTMNTPNLVIGLINNVYVNSSGVLSTNSSLNGVITPVEKDKVYIVLHATGGNMFCGFFEEYPIKDASTYNGERFTFKNEYYTFTAPITGYLVSSCSLTVTDPVVYEGFSDVSVYIGDT